MIAVRDVLREDHRLETIEATEPLTVAISRFGGIRARCLLVTEGDALVGVVSIRDILRHIAEHGADALEQDVAAAMTSAPTTITPDDRLGAVAELFAKSSFNHLPVVDDGVLVGVVTPADVLRTHLDNVKEEAGYLRDYVSGVYY